MISSEHVVSIFGRNLWVANRQVEGLSHEDSLVQPPFRGNCINWILGHVLTSRQAILDLLEQEGVIPRKELAVYEFDSEPVTAESEGVLSLEKLLALMEESQKLLAAELEAQGEEDWLKEINDKGTKLWERVEFLSWHEAYHVGQLELLRQMTGKDDKVI